MDREDAFGEATGDRHLGAPQQLGELAEEEDDRQGLDVGRHPGAADPGDGGGPEAVTPGGDLSSPPGFPPVRRWPLYMAGDRRRSFASPFHMEGEHARS